MQKQIQFLRCMTGCQAWPANYTYTTAWQWWFIMSISVGLMQSEILLKTGMRQQAEHECVFIAPVTNAAWEEFAGYTRPLQQPGF